MKRASEFLISAHAMAMLRYLHYGNCSLHVCSFVHLNMLIDFSGDCGKLQRYFRSPPAYKNVEMSEGLMTTVSYQKCVSDLPCIMSCASTAGCNAVNYTPTSTQGHCQCELLNIKLPIDPAKLSPKQGTSFYEMKKLQ